MKKLLVVTLFVAGIVLAQGYKPGGVGSGTALAVKSVSANGPVKGTSFQDYSGSGTALLFGHPATSGTAVGTIVGSGTNLTTAGALLLQICNFIDGGCSDQCDVDKNGVMSCGDYHNNGGHYYGAGTINGIGTTMHLSSGVADSQTAIGFSVETQNTFAADGGIIMSWLNGTNGTPATEAYINKDGTLFVDGGILFRDGTSQATAAAGISGGSNTKMAYWTGAGSLSNAANATWTSANNNLGISSAASTGPLTLTSTDSSGNYPGLVVQNTGGGSGLPVVQFFLSGNPTGQLIGYTSAAFGLVNGLNLDVAAAQSVGIRVSGANVATFSSTGINAAAIASGLITLPKLATQSNLTLLANVSGSTASPTAVQGPAAARVLSNTTVLTPTNGGSVTPLTSTSGFVGIRYNAAIASATILAPDDASYDGEKLDIRIFNNSGGAITTTWTTSGSKGFQFSGGTAPTDPATSKHRYIQFRYDSNTDKYEETFRSTGDI